MAGKWVIEMLKAGGAMTNGSMAQADDHKPVVLIVDDDPGLVRLLKNVFRVADFEVAIAANGSEALDVTATQHIDAIVMDLRMPVIDGPELFRRLRARGDLTPVLVASSHGARSAQRELGAEGAIEKPFEPDELVEAVSDLLKVRPSA